MGFFEEAIAAISMKAALEAWGSHHNLFHKGFAQETHDPDIVNATMNYPGIVLKRPVGSKGPFKKHAALPKADLMDTMYMKAAKPEKIILIKKHFVKEDSNARKKEHKAAEAYERAKQLREIQRQKEDAAGKKLAEKRKAATAKAKRALEEVGSRHEQKISELHKQMATINKEIESEESLWETNRKRLEEAIEKAKQ